MKKLFLGLIILFSFYDVFAASNIYFNKKIKNAKNFEINIDIKDEAIKSTFDNYEYLRNQGIIEASLFNYYAEISFDEGTLIVFWKYQQEYISDNYFKNIKYIDDSRPGFRLYFKNNNESKYVEAIDKNYFKVRGKTEKAEVYNLKAEKLNIENDDSVFKEYVKQYQVISFLNKTICITISLYVVPFNTYKNGDYIKATTSDSIIEMFGLPDLIETYFFKWPDEKLKNGLYYSPDVYHSESGEHWRYKKYPDLVIDISSGKRVRDFSTNRNQKFYNQ